MSPHADPKVLAALQQGRRFALVSHLNPDGDAIGSSAAMGFVLKALGKDFRIYNVTGLPEQFQWMELPCPVTSDLEEIQAFDPDWYVVMDCGDLNLTGPEMAAHLPPDKTMVIDHHQGDRAKGAIAWVDTTMAAAGEMVALVARELALPLTGPLGEALYLALVSDTGYFSYGNTRAVTMRIGAEILEGGLNPGDFRVKYLNQWSLGRIRLWSQVLDRASMHCGGRVAFMGITQDYLARTGTTMEETDGLVDFIRRIRGVEAAVVLKEEGPGTAKFSLRSDGDTDVQRVAASLGGGGHVNAAGGRIEAPFNQAKDILLAAIGATLFPDCPVADPGETIGESRPQA